MHPSIQNFVTKNYNPIKTIVIECVKELMDGPHCYFADEIDGYQTRPTQISGTINSAIALLDCKNAVVEAPCGYGKSASYLAASMIAMQIQHGIALLLKLEFKPSKIVIATSGIQLQEQIYFKDAPMVIRGNEIITRIIEDHLDLPDNELRQELRVTYVKGRNNFLCHAKLDSIRADQSSAPAFNVNYKLASNIARWSRETKTGDKRELDFVPAYQIWKDFSSTSEECSGKNCPFFSTCYYQDQKKRAARSSFIVTNYHLLIADAIVKRYHANVLGFYDYLICDEAHTLTAIARDFMEEVLSLRAVKSLSRHLKRARKAAEKVTPLKGLVEKAGGLYYSLTKRADGYFTETLPGTIVIAESERSMDGAEHILAKMQTVACDEIIRPLGELKDFLDKNGYTGNDEDIEAQDSEDKNEKTLMKALHAMSAQCENLIMLAYDLEHKENFLTNAYWVAVDKYNTYSLHRKPTDVSGFLQSDIFGAADASVSTSATLSSGGNFDYYIKDTGMTNTTEDIAQSPFDMESQQIWYKDKNVQDPKERNKWQVSCANTIKNLIAASKGGVLCLFTSKNNMNYCFDIVNPYAKSKGLRIIRQGDSSKANALRDFTEDSNTILFGLKTFFTGIDVKGPALRCLCIDRLPFPTIDAFEKALKLQAILQNGRSAGYKLFSTHSIPLATINLKQAIGRGIRSNDDHCVMCVMDGRFYNSSYGGVMQNSFGHGLKMTSSLVEIEAFVSDYMSEHADDESEVIIEEE